MDRMDYTIFNLLQDWLYHVDWFSGSSAPSLRVSSGLFQQGSIQSALGLFEGADFSLCRVFKRVRRGKKNICHFLEAFQYSTMMHSKHTRTCRKTVRYLHAHQVSTGSPVSVVSSSLSAGEQMKAGASLSSGASSCGQKRNIQHI